MNDGDGDGVLAILEQRRDIVFLKLENVVIESPAGSHSCVADPLPVDFRDVKAKRGMQSVPASGFFRKKVFSKQNVLLAS